MRFAWNSYVPGGLAALMLLACALVACRSLGAGSHAQAPTSCADCHRTIAREWRDSPHARAWVSESFAAESRQRTKAECLPCHAPGPLLEQAPDRLPVLRAGRREDGVDCSACHRKGCAQAGPCASGHAPHATVHDGGVLRESAFCGRCHEQEHLEHRKLYVPSVGEDEAKTCIECHMPASVARLTQGHLLSKAHPKRVVRHHGFDAFTPALLRRAVEVSSFSAQVMEEGGVAVSFGLVNRGAGHRIPTGKHGYRELRVHVQLLDAGGTVLASDEESFLGDTQDGLEPGAARAFAFELPGGEAGVAARVRLQVERVDEEGAVVGSFLRLERRVDS